MSGTSNIEWTDTTWNPTTGCSKVSPGCAHCYAETLTQRYAGAKGWPAEFKPWTPANAAENVVLHPSRLEDPFKWRTPRRVFVNSMSDLFHEEIPDEFIDKVFAVMALTPQHQYQVLTKRPERMRQLMTAWKTQRPFWAGSPYPLPNVWLGVTVENQRWADERIPILLDTPAAVRFVSAEPLLGPVDLRALRIYTGETEFEPDVDLDSLSGLFIQPDEYLDGKPHVSWVIVGGESGPKHRLFDPDWAREIVKDCAEAGVACFVKQLGGARPGTRLEDLPADLRVREFPA